MIDERRADCPNGNERQSHTRTAVAAFILVALLSTAGTAWGQEWSGSLSNSLSSASGDITSSLTCPGYVWPDDSSFQVSITGTLSVNGSVIDQRTNWGLGSAHLEPPLQGSASIGRDADTRVECWLSSTFGAGHASGSPLVYPRRVPQSLEVDADIFTYSGLGNYERYREYRVRDNYGFAYGYSGATVDESWSYGIQRL